MLNIVKIEGSSAHDGLQKFLSRQSFLPIFFFSPYTLNTYFTHNGKNLYIVTNEEQETLIISRERPKEIRFLFNDPSTAMKKAIFEHFKPVYASVNEISFSPKEVVSVDRPEAELPLLPIANLADKNIRKKYNQCKRNHPNLHFEIYSPEYIEKIRLFIEKWIAVRNEKLDKDKFVNAKNDLHFFELYNYNPEVIGGVVMDSDDVVGISFSVPSLNGGLISVINKCLRGYTELGVFTYVERSRFLCGRGFGSV